MVIAMSSFIEGRLAGDFEAALEKLEASVKEKVLYSGAAAMASVIAQEARHWAPTSSTEHYFYGSSYKKTGQKYLFQPGNLKRSIYWAYSADKSSADKKTYRISWNRKKVPYGYMVEFGTSRAGAHPFMRPAFSKIDEAIRKGKDRMAERLKEAA